MEAVGLQTHIWNNNLRSAFLLTGFPVLLLGIVYALELGMIGAGMLPSTGSLPGDLAYAMGLMAAASPLAIAVAAIWFVIAYFANTTIIGMATGAHTVTRAEEPALYNLLENLCISRGLKPPRLAIIETGGMNAFASGVDASQYTITVTRGLMEALSADELEGVLAHELTHVINRDVRTMVIASVFAGVITLIAQIVYRAVAWGGVGRREGRRGGGGLLVLVALVAVAVGYVLSIVIRMALSRSREFVADAGAVELTKKPDAMISALQKIAGHSEVEAPNAVRALFLENRGDGAFDLFATHPPIAKRIDALVRFAGGRVAPVAVIEPDRSSARIPGPWDEPKVGPWS